MIEKIAELLLLKDKNFKEKERLRDLLRNYIKIKDEISYLEDILEDFENLDVNLKHLKRDADIIKSILPKLSKFTNIPVFMDIIKMLDAVEKIDTKELEAIRWEINKETDELRDELKSVENELKSIIVKEAISKIGTSDLNEFLKYLENLKSDNNQKEVACN
ncbi:hypothetical protein [Methanocaldococcus fervens]|uniref:Uncharacterized protein n=1 Tax=Methanocaldococcus fervens (strain DSM 4213 / JCM 15782 / AG86) TaxID=573064 RepID=C7P7C0_METFA|nr:hypothetical protein [Methanocaldococcus fervens]ACV24452.1 hypothetical protein Mefer_0632 [Methanocaldococcus fervens AG86]